MSKEALSTRVPNVNEIWDWEVNLKALSISSEAGRIYLPSHHVTILLLFIMHFLAPTRSTSYGPVLLPP